MRRILTMAFVIALSNGSTMISAPGTQTQNGLDPTIVDPTHFKVEFENEYVRVIRGKVEPGHQVTHTHPSPGAVIVALTSAEVRLTLAGGSSRQISYRAGDVRWSTTSDPHRDEVISDGPFELIRIEPKEPK